MSQKKVDKYKADKANRSALIKKEKRIVRLEILAAALIMTGLLGWFGSRYYRHLENAKPPTEYQIDTGAVDSYLEGLTATVEEQ